MWWLLEENTRRNMQLAIDAGFTPSAEQLTAFNGSFSGGESSIINISGEVAQISVRGVLTNTPDIIAMLFGGGNTTYPQIIEAFAQAEGSSDVKRIELLMESGGGQIEGLFEAIAAVQAATKPVIGIVQNVAASAAYGILAQADSIRALSPATQFGSIGIAASFIIDENEITLTSTEAPDKRPDVTTEEGKAVVVAQLDAVHDIFVDAIAVGRNTTADKINAEFGRGAVLLADEALKRGMIDTTAQAGLRLVASTKYKQTASNGGDNPETGTMDLATFMAQHPDVYSEAVQVGVAKERDRVGAHLTMGQQCGDLQTAHTAITEGTEMTATLTAKYLTAGRNRSDIDARQDDDNSATAGDTAAEANADEHEKGKKVGADIMKQAANSLGLVLEA